METDTVTPGEWIAGPGRSIRLRTNTIATDPLTGKEVIAVAEYGACGRGTSTPCVYLSRDGISNLCHQRSCGRLPPDDLDDPLAGEPTIKYVSKLAYLNAKILSL